MVARSSRCDEPLYARSLLMLPTGNINLFMESVVIIYSRTGVFYGAEDGNEQASEAACLRPD